jgi:hypothetical protein
MDVVHIGSNGVKLAEAVYGRTKEFKNHLTVDELRVNEYGIYSYLEEYNSYIKQRETLVDRDFWFVIQHCHGSSLHRIFDRNLYDVKYIYGGDEAVVIKKDGMKKIINVSANDVYTISGKEVFELTVSIPNKKDSFVALLDMSDGWVLQTIQLLEFRGFELKSIETMINEFTPLYASAYICFSMGVELNEEEIFDIYKKEKGDVDKREFLIDYGWIDQYIFNKVYPILESFVDEVKYKTKEYDLKYGKFSEHIIEVDGVELRNIMDIWKTLGV